MKHNCSYCGGWEEKEKDTKDIGGINTNKSYTAFALVIENEKDKEERNICTKCLIKTFDIVLGIPKEIVKQK